MPILWQKRNSRITRKSEQCGCRSTPTGSRTIAVSSERHASGEKSHSFCHSFSGANVQQLAAALVALAAVPMDDATRSTVAREIAERLADEGCR
jgi:hypothetical protein